MAKRPAFQFYPADWRNNANLRRCSPAARGAWVDVMCLLHDSDEYGVLRWPLADIAEAAGVPIDLLHELSRKAVLKGADIDAEDYLFAPSHAGKRGDEVRLVVAGNGPCWYCSRFVKDEWVRSRRGAQTRFDADNQPPKQAPKAKPTRRVGGRQGDGPSSASSSSFTKSVPRKRGANPKVAMPADFGVSERVVDWAARKGHSRLAEHMEAFKRKVAAHGYRYADWDEAFMGAVTDGWAKLPPLASSAVQSGKPKGPSETPLEAQLNWIAHMVRTGGMSDDEALLERQKATEKYRGST